MVGRPSITRTVSPGSPAMSSSPAEAPWRGSSSSSSAPGPTISMCDWPSSLIIWLATR
jgi:hypothetical protein